MGLCLKPRDLALSRQKHDEARAVQEILPHVFVTSFGARVASQQTLSSELVKTQ